LIVINFTKGLHTSLAHEEWMLFIVYSVHCFNSLKTSEEKNDKR